MTTRNFVPRANEEGNIGTSLKNWLKGWFKDLFVSGDLTDGSHNVSVEDLVDHLDTPVTSFLYVDGKRADTYTPDGSMARPFKTVAAALAAAPPYSTIKIAAKSDGGGSLLSYTEDLAVPANVSLEGDQHVIIEGNVALAGTGSPTRLRGIMFSGAAKTLTLRGSVSIWDCVATCAVVYDSAAASQAWNFHLLPSASGVVPLTMLSTGKFQSFMASIIAQGDVPAIAQQGGSLILNTVLVTAGRAGPVLLGTGGTAALVATQVINSLGGTALDLSANGATASNPNMLSGVLAVGNAVCGAKTTMVEGIQFVSTGSLTGTALLFRPANLLKYTPAVGANWVDPDPTTVQAAVDRMAALLVAHTGAPIP